MRHILALIFFAMLAVSMPSSGSDTFAAPAWPDLAPMPAPASSAPPSRPALLAVSASAQDLAPAEPGTSGAGAAAVRGILRAAAQTGAFKAAPIGPGDGGYTAARAYSGTACGIQGQVLIGRLAKVESRLARPYRALISVFDQSGQVVTRFVTNGQGWFRVSLVPGRYTIHPESAARYPRAPEQTVTVTKGQFVTLQIVYDSGIR